MKRDFEMDKRNKYRVRVDLAADTREMSRSISEMGNGEERNCRIKWFELKKN